MSRVTSYASSTLTSVNRLRNADVLVLFIRIRLSLCWTSGWSMTWTRLDMRWSPPSEQRAVAGDSNRWRAGPPGVGQLAPGCPGAAFQDLDQGKLGRVQPHAHGHQWREAIEEGHGQRPPLHDHRGTGRVRDAGHVRMLGDEDVQVDEQPAVAILRETGELIEARDAYAGFLERLHPRIGQPLGQLVKRAETGRGAAAACGRMRPRVAEAHAVQLDPLQIG